MAQKKLVLELVGEDVVIDGAVDAFVRQNGWTEESKDADGNPISKNEKARLVIRQFFLDTVTAWNVEAAKQTAANAAVQQTQTIIDLAELTLTEQ